MENSNAFGNLIVFGVQCSGLDPLIFITDIQLTVMYLQEGILEMVETWYYMTTHVQWDMYINHHTLVVLLCIIVISKLNRHVIGA